MNAKPQKVFFFPGLLSHGGEKVVADLSLQLPDSFDIAFILYEGTTSYSFKGRVIEMGVPNSTNFILRGMNFFIRFFKFKHILQKEHPDIVVSAGNGPNVMNILLNAKKAVVRVDMHVSQGNRGFWGIVYKVFIRLFFNRAQRIVSVSKVAAEDLMEHFGVSKEKIQVIYNMVDIEKIWSLAQESLPSEYQELFQFPVIATMGRLTQQKGQWHLIKALKQVQKALPNAKLVILGEGELKDFLQRTAKEEEVEDSVVFLGWRKNPFPFLARSRVFVLPSLWEGLPTVLLEAMACRIPVISTDCESGPREILEFGQHGILVPPEDEKSLGDAIQRMLKDPVLQKEFGEKAQQRVEKFRPEYIRNDWISLFKEYRVN